MMSNEKKCTCLVPMTPETAEALEVLKRQDDKVSWDAAAEMLKPCAKHPRPEA